MGTEVVGLGAWCDYETVEEYRDRMSGPVAPPAAPADAVPGLHVPDDADLAVFARHVSFRIEEFARLADGRTVTLTDDRGWGIGDSRPVEEVWAGLTVESVESDVLMVVLPDDAEETGEEHPWAWLAQLARDRGADTTAERLRELPYEVVLSDRLRARLSPPRHGG